jgi:hypothetical protein
VLSRVHPLRDINQPRVFSGDFGDFASFVARMKEIAEVRVAGIVEHRGASTKTSGHLL